MNTSPISHSTPPGILSDIPRRAPMSGREAPRSTRFVTQSHVLSRQGAGPRAMIVAATIALAIYLIGRRLSD